jgi:glutathionyl-hydroquinone reductase
MALFYTTDLSSHWYADCSRALKDLLPWLILSTLSSHINATLAAIKKSNNGYDYLWHVLELTVPRFDPVITIQTPLWSDADDIFQFSQSYLLYFQLQAKMQYHFTDRVQHSTLLHAIHHSEYMDMITTLQSHMNSYQENFDTGFLPTHLRTTALQKVSTSVHRPGYTISMHHMCNASLITVPWYRSLQWLIHTPLQ